MKLLSERWKKFWFEPASPTNLGVCRILFFGALFLFYLPKDFSAWTLVSKAFWMPIGLFAHLHLPVFNREILNALQWIWKLSLLFGCIGLWTRASTKTSFIFGLYLLGLPHNFGKTHHFDAMIIFALGIMALSYCEDGWSIDRMIHSAREGNIHKTRASVWSGEYTWPIRAVWLVIVTIIFAAGVSKIRHSSLSWVTSDNMAIILISQNYHLSNADPWSSWGLNIAQHAWLFRSFALFTIIFEISYPLALFSIPARWVLVPGVLLMLIGIRALMGPTFWLFMICHLFWIPWDRVGLWLGEHFPKPQKITVLYDGGCGLCQGTIFLILTLDLLQRVEIVDVVNDWSGIQKRFPRLKREACLTDMHVVTAKGKIFIGFDSYRALVWVLPLGWLVLPFLYLPLVRPIGRRVYSAVASQRHQGSCSIK